MKFRKSKIVREIYLRNRVTVVVKRLGNQFTSSVVMFRDSEGHIETTKSILGEYRTIEDAIKAASLWIEMLDGDHICKPSDIEKVRKEIRQREAAK